MRFAHGGRTVSIKRDVRGVSPSGMLEDTGEKHPCGWEAAVGPREVERDQGTSQKSRSGHDVLCHQGRHVHLKTRCFCRWPKTRLVRCEENRNTGEHGMT